MPPTSNSAAAASLALSAVVEMVSTDAGAFMDRDWAPSVPEPGRGRGNRTPNLRFWRPPLCQLSYTPRNLDESLDDLGDDAGADGASALADGEAQALLHGDRRDQRDLHLHVVARHDHLRALGQLDAARHVGGAEVELRPVVVEERRVAPALVLREHVHLALELRV